MVKQSIHDINENTNHLDKTPKVIGEGAYGCVHSPALECELRSKKRVMKNKISKIMLTKKARDELKSYTIVNSIDKNHEYHLHRPFECKVRKTRKNINAINKCPQIMHNFSKIDDYSLIIMENAGIDIEKFVQKASIWPNVNGFREKMKLFWIEFERMIKAVDHLLKNGIVHHDIKILNILYNISKNRTNLIDFGLVDKIQNKIKLSNESNNWLGNKFHWSYPFEVILWNKNKYMNFVNLSQNEKESYYQNIIDEITGLYKTNTYNEFRTFFSDVLPTNNVNSNLYQQFTRRYFDDYHYLLCEKINANNYDLFLRKSLSTIDIFGIGMVMAYTLKNTQHLVPEKFEQDMIELIYSILTPNVFERREPHYVLKKYKQILNENGFTHLHT